MSSAAPEQRCIAAVVYQIRVTVVAPLGAAVVSVAWAQPRTRAGSRREALSAQAEHRRRRGASPIAPAESPASARVSTRRTSVSSVGSIVGPWSTFE